MIKRDNSHKVAGTQEFGKAACRFLRSYGRRAKEGSMDLDALDQMLEIQREIDEQLQEVVSALRADGYSWEQIGSRLGMTKSAAYKKFKVRAGIAEEPEGALKRGGQPGHLR